jgi:hypothetical protein
MDALCKAINVEKAIQLRDDIEGGENANRDGSSQ